MKKRLSIWLCLVLVLSLVFSPDMAEAKKKSKIKLNKKKVTLYVGQKVRLKVKGTKKKVKWKSSKKKIATVSKKGTVKAKKKGTAKITAKVAGKKLVCKVKVKNKKIIKKTQKPVAPTKKPVVPDSAKPDNSQKPDNSKKPSDSENPQTSTKPGESGNPSDSDKPTQTPGTSSTMSPTPGTTKKPPVTVSPSPGVSAKPTQMATQKPATQKPVTPAPTPFTPVVTKTASFSNGTDGFTSRGDVKVTSAPGGKEGNCLSVTGRTASWNGAGYEAGATMVAGATYQIEAYVKLASGTGTIKCTYQDAENSYNEIASVTASTEWTKITKTFTVPESFTQFYIYFETPENEDATKTVSFYIDEIVLTQTKASTIVEVDSIKDAYGTTFGMVGTCLNLNQMKDAKTLAYVKKHYNSFTLENEMKPDSVLGNWNKQIIQTTEAKSQTGNYVIPESYKETTIPKLNFTSVDESLKIAKANGLKMRAHTLVWHSQTPEWFFKEGYDNSGEYVTTEVMNARMEMYIRSVMNHVYTLDNGAYKDVVYVWDVANEYLNNNADANWSAVYGNRSGDLENNPPYLKKAFEIAYDMLKKFDLIGSVSLMYNDFNTYVGNHPDSVVELINYINKDEPAKICQGIGMQSHLDVDYPSADLFTGTVKKFIDAGFEVQITELDVTINNNNGSYKDEGQTNEQQAEYIGELMKKLIAVQNSSGKKITGLTLWGLYDTVSWRGGAQQGGNSHPLLFDTGLNDAKPSYYSFMEAIKG